MPSPTDRNLTARPTKIIKTPARRQARHFTMLDQVTQLVAARDADPDRRSRPDAYCFGLAIYTHRYDSIT